MQNGGQDVEQAEKAKEYNAQRLSVAPMMDWAADMGFIILLK